MNSLIAFGPGEIGNYFAARVPDLKQTKMAEWRGACPIHGGNNDSFAVESSTGRWCCHSACGRGGDIFDLEAALSGGDFPTRKVEVFRLVGRTEPAQQQYGTRMSGNFAGTTTTKPSEKVGGWQEVASYAYSDWDGTLQYQTIREENPDGEKRFKQRRPDGQGGWIWNLQDVKRVPYRLPNLLNSDTVYLVEGEKDVHTLEGWGLVASCNPGGSASSSLYAGWGDYFRSRNIITLPDNDKPGRKHAAAVAGALLTVAASVRIVELPGLPEKGDVTDWRDGGGTLEQFLELAEVAAPLDAAALAELRGRWRLAGEESEPAVRVEAANDWPKPEPIQSELPRVQSFTEDLLPDSFRALVTDVADRLQVPMDLPGIVTVLCLAGAVNRRAVIQPKANDTGWTLVPNLWGGIIAPPGYLKSPCIQTATRPLAQIQAEWRREHQLAQEGYAQSKEEHELKHAAWKDKYKANVKVGKAVPERPGNGPTEPKLLRLISNDSTFEALHQTMSENPAGILVIRDELTGWWGQLDKPGREGERAFCLQAWNGDTEFTLDRIGRGTIHVPACCMSMLGGIQPGRLRSYLVDALEDGPNNDGLIQRFQLLVWPDVVRDFRYVDRPPNADAEQQAALVFRSLVERDANNPIRFRFASDAQELFIDWLKELEVTVRGDELHPALISHLSKYRSLMPSLALLFHLADVAAGKGQSDLVSLRHTQQAAAWCEYLESHARRVYSCFLTPQLRSANELAEKIKHGKIGAEGFFTCRDVYLSGWSGLNSPEAAQQATRLLQDAGWLRKFPVDSGPNGGRPSVRYEVNPAVRQ